MILDYRQNELVEGATVAFNYAGAVRVGTIVQITETRRYRTFGHLFRVRHEHGISKVTSKDNLIVIKEQV